MFFEDFSVNQWVMLLDVDLLPADEYCCFAHAWQHSRQAAAADLRSAHQDLRTLQAAGGACCTCEARHGCLRLDACTPVLSLIPTRSNVPAFGVSARAFPVWGQPMHTAGSLLRNDLSRACRCHSFRLPSKFPCEPALVADATACNVPRHLHPAAALSPGSPLQSAHEATVCRCGVSAGYV